MNSQFRNWSDIRIFLAVYREGSTLAASRKLGIAQPTVARRIDVLEHETGLTLFERDTRGFRPTCVGKELFPQAEGMEAAAQEFVSQVSALTLSKPIRITAFSANFSPRINKIFSDFSIKHPDIRLEFMSSVKALDLIAGEADIALRIARNPQHPDLICHHISTAQFTLYGAESYAREYGLPKSPDDLAGHKFVTFLRDGVPPGQHDWIATRVKPEQIVATFSEVEMADSAIADGVGLGIGNVRLHQDRTDLIQCFPPAPENDVPHVVVISPDAWRRPEVKTFIKFFVPRYKAVFT